jgi:AcrR family transcriptional regulator
LALFVLFLNECSFNKNNSFMPRTQQQFQVMQEESRAAILQAASELFAEQGFVHTSVSAIAKRAGISQGLMYNYFASKDELLRAIFERGWEDVQASFLVAAPKGAQRKEAEGKGTERPSLFDFIENACRLTLKHQSFWRLLHSLRSQPATLERLGGRVREFEQMILVQLEAFCAASEPVLHTKEISHNAQAEARLVFALVDGICTHLVRQPDTYPLNEVLECLKPQYQSRFL